eukprot:GEMP01074236.1.p1 GENE.GEMP01074236.1~~GEMP01074236.1.p1  ORF type:complete len:149 (+),score=31.09 GEMP01074236.1:18-464(+)
MTTMRWLCFLWITFALAAEGKSEDTQLIKTAVEHIKEASEDLKEAAVDGGDEANKTALLKDAATLSTVSHDVKAEVPADEDGRGITNAVAVTLPPARSRHFTLMLFCLLLAVAGGLYFVRRKQQAQVFDEEASQDLTMYYTQGYQVLP